MENVRNFDMAPSDVGIVPTNQFLQALGLFYQLIVLLFMTFGANSKTREQVPAKSESYSF